MIKRRFYKHDHGDKTASSSSSSSEDSSSSSDSSDADVPPSAHINEEAEHEEEEEEGEEQQSSPSLGSGYESEDSSSNNLEGDIASGENPEDNELNNVVKESEKVLAGVGAVDMHGPIQADFENFVLKCKSVYKCKICPRIVCLTEKTIKTHLESKRHARSKKLYGEGRLKLMLNSDGEIEDDGETHAERHARTIDLLKRDLNAPKSKDSGRQRQRRRRKRSSNGHSEKVRKEKNNQKLTTKRQRATEDAKS